MTTLSDLIGRVRSQSRDDGGNFITDEDITDWLNEAYVDLAARENMFDDEKNTTTTGLNTLSFPTAPELIEITDLLIGTDDHALLVPSSVFDEFVVNGSVPIATIYRTFENQIEMYPTPNSGTVVTLRYKRLPAPLVDGSDEHILPSQLERKMLEYAKAQVCFKGEDYDGGNNWMFHYENGLRRPSVGRERFSIGADSRAMTELGPFEMDQGYSAR